MTMHCVLIVQTTSGSDRPRVSTVEHVGELAKTISVLRKDEPAGTIDAVKSDEAAKTIDAVACSSGSFDEPVRPIAFSYAA